MVSAQLTSFQPREIRRFIHGYGYIWATVSYAL